MLNPDKNWHRKVMIVFLTCAMPFILLAVGFDICLNRTLELGKKLLA